MEFGLVLPTMGPTASSEMIEVGAALAADLGWPTVWTTDHLLVPHGPEGDEYGRIFEALTTLAYVAGRFPSLHIGTSAIVVGMRQGTVLAKQLATLDVLARGRLIAGVTLGDQPIEFANVERAERYRDRAAYIEETIALWRHLWSGETEPFVGRFYSLTDYVFSPLPMRRAIPIWMGGWSRAAVRRAGRIADGYHATKASPRMLSEAKGILREESAAVGRKPPALSVRLRVTFGPPRPNAPFMLAGSAEEMCVDLEAFARLGVAHVALVFDEPTLQRYGATAFRFDREVVRVVRGRAATGGGGVWNVE